MTRTRLLKNIDLLATMDDERREIRNGAVFVRGPAIEAVGQGDELDRLAADEVIDLGGHVVIPGLINTHHHMYQSLTRVLAQDSELFDWLVTLYPIWSRLRPEHVYVSARLAMTELMLSGCTTSSDHLYIFPEGVSLEDEIRAAQETGMRFHAARGAMSLGESAGGLPPDSLVEDEAHILRDMQAVIQAFHDPAPCSMLQIVLAPCSPFSVTRDLMREAAVLAREYGVHLHTHLAENEKDIAYSREVFGQRPGEYAEVLGWVGPEVWHAHCVHLNDEEIDLFARTQTGVCHCPGSNMRLASGILPLRRMLDRGVPVGLGVDGSASNDSGHLLSEARLAMLLQRVGGDPAALSARQALELATRGGAAVLGRTDIGHIAPGMAADLAAYRLDTPAMAGALHDPLAALVFCQPPGASFVMINGRAVVQEGQHTMLELPVLLEEHNRLSRQLINGD